MYAVDTVPQNFTNRYFSVHLDNLVKERKNVLTQNHWLNV